MVEEERVEARLNILVRLLGFLLLVSGVSLAYGTSTVELLPPLAVTFYLVAALLILMGLAALILRLRR